ncbi:hypothetical protein L6164_019639 [Bauhinia variegata]|uniref:Uncharacterized protein n=1 Tax=Bauhinia variegata TaxID=167791 RepID=A0ACB9MSP8_BAUVA|nr:hypothetical protein L6164_019639 [Bauhinia variegata]
MEDDGGENSSFVIGLIENRAKEVGVAAFDLRTASLHLSQYIETSSSYQNTRKLCCISMTPSPSLCLQTSYHPILAELQNWSIRFMVQSRRVLCY